MGELLLCRQGIASMPYYIESAAVNIYSVEELCYYILHNLYLLDRELVNEELIRWLEKETGERDTAVKLHQIERNGGSLYHFMMTILIETGYCTKEELEFADGVLKELQNKSRFQCKKLRADRFLAERKYDRCIGEYNGLLVDEEIKDEPEDTKGEIFHNLGCAYARLFLFEEAKDCFLHAWEETNNIKSQEMALLCNDLMEQKQAPEEFVSSELDEKMKQAEELKNMQDLDGYFEALWQVAVDWKQEYRRWALGSSAS